MQTITKIISDVVAVVVIFFVISFYLASLLLVFSVPIHVHNVERKSGECKREREQKQEEMRGIEREKERGAVSVRLSSPISGKRMTQP